MLLNIQIVILTKKWNCYWREIMHVKVQPAEDSRPVYVQRNIAPLPQDCEPNPYTHAKTLVLVVLISIVNSLKLWKKFPLHTFFDTHQLTNGRPHDHFYITLSNFDSAQAGTHTRRQAGNLAYVTEFVLWILAIYARGPRDRKRKRQERLAYIAVEEHF